MPKRATLNLNKILLLKVFSAICLWIFLTLTKQMQFIIMWKRTDFFNRTTIQLRTTKVFILHFSCVKSTIKLGEVQWRIIHNTCKKGAATIKGYAFHDPALQILFYNFREIPLQWVLIPENTPKSKGTCHQSTYQQKLNRANSSI